MTEMQVWQAEISDVSLKSRLDEAERKLAEAERKLAEADARIDNMLVRMSQHIDRAAAAERAHRADIELISEKLTDEAENRGWCDEYDSFVRDVNSSLNIELTPRETEHEVSFTLTFVVRVDARDQEEAEERAWDQARDIERYADSHDGTDGNSNLSTGSDY